MAEKLNTFLEEQTMELFRFMIRCQIAVLAGFFAIYHFVLIPHGVLPAGAAMLVFFVGMHLFVLGRLRVVLDRVWKRAFPEFAALLKAYGR